jgi:hypothetical protein
LNQYYFLGSLGRQTQAAGSLLRLALDTRGGGERLPWALDDTPTPRYGPKVQGAGLHHNPTPGPTDQQFLYGHRRGTLAWGVGPARWGTVGLPLLALGYGPPKGIAPIPTRAGWPFQAQLQRAVRLAQRLVGGARFAGKTLWGVVDGGYARAPFLQPALAGGVVPVGRRRKDAALRDVPPPVRPGQRRGPGRPRPSGKSRISLAKRAGPKRGWQTIAALLDGERVAKPIKTLLAPWPSVGGVLRVGTVHEERGWLPCFCTGGNAPAAQSLGAGAARSATEPDCHGRKEGEGLGQQQVRNRWADVAVFRLNLWAPTLVELGAGAKPKRELGDPKASPGDEAARRPSHAGKRKALQRHCLAEAIPRAGQGQRLTGKLQRLLRGLIRLVS